MSIPSDSKKYSIVEFSQGADSHFSKMLISTHFFPSFSGFNLITYAPIDNIVAIRMINMNRKMRWAFCSIFIAGLTGPENIYRAVGVF